LNILLDTHIILWSAAEEERISKRAIIEIESPANTLWYSPVSVWEILVLAEKGRIQIGPLHEKAVREMFKKLPLKEAALNTEVAVQSRLIDLPHQDPADRFLAATAVVYGFTMLTADKRILEARSFSTMPAVD